MGLDYRFSYFFSQLGWAAPTVIAVAVIAVLALMRRDEGLWWKLVIAGAAALLLGQAVSLIGNVFIYEMAPAVGAWWIVTIPATLLHLVGLSLFGAGAIVGRRGQVATR